MTMTESKKSETRGQCPNNKIPHTLETCRVICNLPSGGGWRPIEPVSDILDGITPLPVGQLKAEPASPSVQPPTKYPDRSRVKLTGVTSGEFIQQKINQLCSEPGRSPFDEAAIDIFMELLDVIKMLQGAPIGTQTQIPLLDPNKSVGENYDMLWARYATEPPSVPSVQPPKKTDVYELDGTPCCRKMEVPSWTAKPPTVPHCDCGAGDDAYLAYHADTCARKRYASVPSVEPKWISPLLNRAMVILKTLDISVKWELAPSIKQAIHELCAEFEATLPTLPDPPKGDTDGK